MSDVAPERPDVSSSGTFGDYHLRGLLGRGGMGDVHRAYDARRGREVALKLLPPHLANDRTLVERFRREARALVRLTDPNIVPVHDFGEIDGRLFIDMALVEGRDLADLLSDGGPMAAARAVHVVEQAGRALDTAHRSGLVHRDVKPSNLLVLTDRGDFTYLVDFGIAHAVGAGTVGTSLTSSSSTIGTLAYMSPERFVSESSVDGRADVYALACVLHESLTGVRPFPFESVPALLNAHLNTPPPRVTDLRPDLGPAWDRVIARGMAKDPADRHPTAGALAADARAALAGVRGAVAPPAPVLPFPPQQRSAGLTQRPSLPPVATLRPPVTPPQTRHDGGGPPARSGRTVVALLIAAVVLAIAAIAVPVVIYNGKAPSGTPSAAAPAQDTAGAANPPAALPSSTTTAAVPADAYRSYRSEVRGYAVDVPTALSESSVPDNNDGVRLGEPDGQATLVVYGSIRFPGDDPSTLLAAALAQATAGGGTTTYSDKDADSFTGSGLDRSGMIFHIHGQLSDDSVAVVSWSYPPAEKERWDAAVTRTTKTLAFD